MRSEFCFNPEKETVDDYLTRVAPILDEIRDDKKPAVMSELAKSIDNLERMELEEEVARAMHKPVMSEARYVLWQNSGNFGCYREDYKAELLALVYMNIHRFNNPRYHSAPGKYSLYTFIKPYTWEATRRVLKQKRDRSEADLRKENHIKKIQDALLQIDPDSDVYDVHLLMNNQHLATDSMELSEKQIQKTIELMQDICYLSDIDKEYIEEAFDYVEQRDLIDQFIKAYEEYPEFEQYIYRQSLRLRNGEITVAEITVDPELLKICKANPKLSKKIKKEKIQIKRPKGSMPANSVFKEHLPKTLIENTYRKIDKRLREMCMKYELTPEEKLGFVRYILQEE